MSDVHEHAWTPVEGECAVYACACGATGYRLKNSTIAAHKEPKRFLRPTAKPRGSDGHRPDFEVEGADGKESS